MKYLQISEDGFKALHYLQIFCPIISSQLAVAQKQSCDNWNWPWLSLWDLPNSRYSTILLGYLCQNLVCFLFLLEPIPTLHWKQDCVLEIEKFPGIGNLLQKKVLCSSVFGKHFPASGDLCWNIYQYLSIFISTESKVCMSRTGLHIPEGSFCQNLSRFSCSLAHVSVIKWLPCHDE